MLLNISTWATTGVTTLWTYFEEHVHDLEPLPPLPTTLPSTHTVDPELSAPVMDLTASDTPVRPVGSHHPPHPSDGDPPPEPPPPTLRPPITAHAPTHPTATMAPNSPCSPRTPRSPWTNLAGADHG